MDWAPIKEGLAAWVAQAGGVPRSLIAWNGEPVVHRNYPQIDLDLTQHRSDRTTDEVRYEITADGTARAVVYGHRFVTWTITWSSRDQHANAQAVAVLDTIRTLLESPRADEWFAGLDVSVHETGATQSIPVVSEHREISSASISVTLAYTVSERDEVYEVGPIESVEVGGTIGGLPSPDIEVPEQVIP